MNIYWFYKDNNKSIQSTFDYHRWKIKSKLSKGPTKANAKALERLLNNKFYGDTDQADKYIGYIRDYFVAQDASMKERIASWHGLDDVSLSERARTIQDPSEISGLIKKYRSDQKQIFNKYSISAKGLKEKADALNKALAQFKKETIDMKNGSEIYATLEKNILEAQNLITQMLSQEGLFSDSKGKSFAEYNNFTFKISDTESINFEAAVNAINQVYFNYVLPVEDAGITNSQIGDIFEYALGFIAYEGINDAVGEVTKGMLKGLVTGGETANRGSGNVSQSTVTFEADKKLDENGHEKKGFEYQITENVKITTNKTGFSSFNPYKDTQMKQDVNLTYKLPGYKNPKNFRISAKNWASLENRGFDTYSVAYSMYRSLNEYDFGRYLFAIGGSKKAKEYEIAHKLAYLCIFSDVVMGYSQDSGYADTVVVNDRSKKEIKVISLKEVANKIANDNLGLLSSGSFIGSYDEGEVEEVLQEIYKKGSKFRTGEDKFFAMRAYIASLKATLKFTSLLSFYESK